MGSLSHIYRQIHRCPLVFWRTATAVFPRILIKRHCAHGSSSVAYRHNQIAWKGSAEDRYYNKEKEADATAILANLNEVEREALEEIKMTYEDLRSKLNRVPRDMTNTMWLDLMCCKTISMRRKRLDFWFQRECAKENAKLSDEKRKQTRALRNEHSPYSKDGTVLKGTYNYALASRTGILRRKAFVNSILLGHPIVFDMEFEEYERRYLTNVHQQLHLITAMNLRHPEPFRLFATGIKENGRFDEILAIDKYNIKMELYNKCFSEMFPRDQLVYLTPDSQHVLQYNPNDIYILGAINDKKKDAHETIDKATKLNIRHARLPLHLVSTSKKVLTLNHVMGILLDVQVNRRWLPSIYTHIPSRTLQDDEYRPQTMQTLNFFDK